MKRFPRDCDCNCPHYSEYDLCDMDFSLYLCPKSEIKYKPKDFDKKLAQECTNNNDINFYKSLEEINKITDMSVLKELADKYRKLAKEMGCLTEEAIYAELRRIEEGD